MSKTNAFELGILQLVLQNADLAAIGDATGLRGSSTAGSYYIALCDADPGEGGDLVNNEIDSAAVYTQYTRVAVARNGTEWVTDGGNGLQNGNAVTFPKMTSGTNVTATHFAICKAGTAKVDDAIYSEALNSSLLISANVTPSFAAGALVVTEG